MSGPQGAFPPPPVQDPAAALHDASVAALQRLHNHLAVHRPRALAAAEPGHDAVDVAVTLLQKLPPETVKGT